jgi:uncharacterized membrane protein
MIDRKTLWITLALAALMLTAAVWRIALLPDWTEFPLGNGRMLHHSYFALFLFVPPFWMIVALGIVAARNWLARGVAESIRPWTRWHSTLLIAGGALMTAMQFSIVARSLSTDDILNPMMMTRIFTVATGVLMIATGNRLPKLPWLASRLAILDLPPAQGAELLRFQGWLNVCVGAAFVLAGAFFPFRFMFPVMFGTVTATLIVTQLRRTQLKRERSKGL